jgi:hypothetical protein
VAEHRSTYVALVVALREEFHPLGLESLWLQMRDHRYNPTSLGTLAQAVHDARDIAYDVEAVSR